MELDTDIWPHDLLFTNLLYYHILRSLPATTKLPDCIFDSVSSQSWTASGFRCLDTFYTYHMQWEFSLLPHDLLFHKSPVLSHFAQFTGHHKITELYIQQCFFPVMNSQWLSLFRHVIYLSYAVRIFLITTKWQQKLHYLRYFIKYRRIC